MGDGLFQVTDASTCQSQKPPGYGNTHDGYLRNVRDAIQCINKGYDQVINSTNDNYDGAFAHVPDWVVVLSVLHYNATYDPIGMYQSAPPEQQDYGNRNYLHQVAQRIDQIPSVSSDFGCLFQVNSRIKDSLEQGQTVVNDLIDHWNK